MSNKVELTEEQIEEMGKAIERTRSTIEQEKDSLQKNLSSIQNFGNGSLDLKIIELFELKNSNLQKQYEVAEQYARLWDQIVEKMSNIDSDLSSSFKEWSDV